MRSPFVERGGYQPCTEPWDSEHRDDVVQHARGERDADDPVVHAGGRRGGDGLAVRIGRDEVAAGDRAAADHVGDAVRDHVARAR
jgi:hypothetical protein